MPSWNDTLLTLAEISIAVLGFAGLIGVFARRQKLTSFSQEFLKLRWLLDYGIFSLILALLPFLVFAADPVDATGWRISSGLVVLSFAGYSVAHRKVLIGSFAMGRLAKFSIIGDWVFMLVLTGNVVGAPIPPNPFSYLVVAFWFLFGAIAGFAQLVSLIWIDNDDQAGPNAESNDP